jgi:hypothetical protein
LLSFCLNCERLRQASHSGWAFDLNGFVFHFLPKEKNARNCKKKAATEELGVS